VAGLSFTHHEGALGSHAGAALAGFVVAVFPASGRPGAAVGGAGDSGGSAGGGARVSREG